MTAAELPDFQSAPAWMGASGEVALRETLVTAVNCRHLMVIDWPALDAPWTPLDTPKGHVQRIDRDKLADVIDSIVAPDDLTTEHIERMMRAADAVLAALPELMGGEGR